MNGWLYLIKLREMVVTYTYEMNEDLVKHLCILLVERMAFVESDVH